MSILSTRKIIESTYQTNSNKQEIGKLIDKSLKKVSFNWGHNTEEVVLLENYNSNAINKVFTINNISENILKYTTIICYVTNGIVNQNAGFVFGERFSCLLDKHILMTSSKSAKLYVKGTVSALTDDVKVIPIFWTVKLVYKPLISKK